MTRIVRLMHMHKLMAPAADELGSGGSGGGGGGGGYGELPTEEQKAEKANADAAKLAADKAAADAVKLAAEGGAKPTDAEAKLLKDVMRHKGRAGELETQLAEVNQRLKQFEGIDAAAVRVMLTEKEEIERKKMEEKGEYDRLVKQMGERHGVERTELLTRVEEANRATQALQVQIAELTVGNAFTSSAFVRDDLTLTPTKARVIYGSHFEYKDGRVVGFDKPVGASDRTMLVSSTSEPLSFEKALLSIIEADPDKDHLLRSKMKTGAASSSAKGVKKSSEPEKSTMSSVERIAAGLKTLAKA